MKKIYIRTFGWRMVAV